MSEFRPARAAGREGRVRWSIIDALRRYGTDASRLTHAFAELHRLQAADLRALVAIMSAEGNDTPLTAGQLRAQLGLSSGGTSLVIDRLEQAGHIRRVRDHPADNRVVHLRYTDQGRATGQAFFGSLGERANAVLDQFGGDELAVIERFMAAMADSVHEHLAEFDRSSLPGRKDWGLCLSGHSRPARSLSCQGGIREVALRGVAAATSHTLRPLYRPLCPVLSMAPVCEVDGCGSCDARETARWPGQARPGQARPGQAWPGG